MKQKLVQLDDETRGVFLRARIDGCELQLTEQMPRPLYAKVAKVIEAAGGKWNRSQGCHIFPADVRETLNINGETIAVVNVQQTYQSFYTPLELAGRVAELADLVAGERVLEPSAGTGNLIKALIEHGIFRGDITAVEINESLAGRLDAGTVVCGDFLAMNGELGTFDKIVMNPPFSRGDDIRHIKHALTHLAPSGKLVAICGNGPKQRETFEPIADAWIDVPAGAFSESGTEVATAIIVLTKSQDDEAPEVEPQPQPTGRKFKGTLEQKAKSDVRKARFHTMVKQIADMTEEQRAQFTIRLGAVATIEGRALSVTNTILCMLQNPAVSIVGGFRQWIKAGRSVRKGEHGMMIWIPIGKRDGKTTELAPTDAPANDGDRKRFLIGTVFSIEQTDEMTGDHAAPIDVEKVTEAQAVMLPTISEHVQFEFLPVCLVALAGRDSQPPETLNQNKL